MAQHLSTGDKQNNLPDLKLRIEMVPAPLWEVNLRKFLPRSKWTSLRFELIEQRGTSCEVCGKDCSGKGKIQAHEEWIYSDDTKAGVARLSGIQLSCWHCHMCGHWGRLQQLSRTLRRAVPDSIKHFCAVNGMSQLEFERHKTEAFDQWRRRSNLEWEVDWGDFSELLLEHWTKLPQPDWLSRSLPVHST